uniref:Uncharacterized protein n=1 Tax=Glossina austeni TaxID=7395 RepID=A0A1A9UJH4_GLOAU
MQAFQHNSSQKDRMPYPTTPDGRCLHLISANWPFPTSRTIHIEKGGATTPEVPKWKLDLSHFVTIGAKAEQFQQSFSSYRFLANSGRPKQDGGQSSLDVAPKHAVSRRRILAVMYSTSKDANVIVNNSSDNIGADGGVNNGNGAGVVMHVQDAPAEADYFLMVVRVNVSQFVAVSILYRAPDFSPILLKRNVNARLTARIDIYAKHIRMYVRTSLFT